MDEREPFVRRPLIADLACCPRHALARATRFAMMLVALVPLLLPRPHRLGKPLLCIEPTTSASYMLATYDAGHRAAAASEGAKGFGGALTANEWAAAAHQPPLAEAVVTMAKAALSHPDEGRLMLGICASDAAEGVQTLKAWVTGLGLPKGPLHGMDKDGEPLDMSTFGSVYIKYNSRPNSDDPPGTSLLSGYNGDCAPPDTRPAPVAALPRPTAFLALAGTP
jgi:hypothetical protein